MPMPTNMKHKFTRSSAEPLEEDPARVKRKPKSAEAETMRRLKYSQQLIKSHL